MNDKNCNKPYINARLDPKFLLKYLETFTCLFICNSIAKG